jgi:hypothetical protein
MADRIHKGGCACGKVRFEASGEPYRAGVCHCMTCRKVHGAPFNFFVVFPIEAVKIEGEGTSFASSEHGRRYSCKACGAPVYSHYDHQDEIDLYGGSFDEPSLFQPSYELWHDRRETWLPEFPSVAHRYALARPKWWRRKPE